MKTDRELLELSIKAAGYKNIHYGRFSGFRFLQDRELFGFNFFPFTKSFFIDKKPWNPLFDMGDALRLASDLDLTVHSNVFYKDEVWCAVVYNSSGDELGWFPSTACRHYAVCRAIVIAAAKIGEVKE